MNLPEQFARFAHVPGLTATRIILALAVAAAADGLQILLAGAGWFGPDQIIDVAAMLLTYWLLGFHWLLLPSFVLNLIPVADDLPTWIACVAAVIVLRKRQPQAPLPLPPKRPPIDI